MGFNSAFKELICLVPKNNLVKFMSRVSNPCSRNLKGSATAISVKKKDRPLQTHQSLFIWRHIIKIFLSKFRENL